MSSNHMLLITCMTVLIIFVVSPEVIAASSGEYVQQPSMNMQTDLGKTKVRALIIDHRAVLAFDRIPEEWIMKAKTKFRISLGHLSHGDQPVKGLEFLAKEKGGVYQIDRGFLDEPYTCLDPGRRHCADWKQKIIDATSNGSNIIIRYIIK